MVDSKELEWIMSNCYGTEKWHRYFPNADFLYTDGVKTFCENAEAYWFLSEIFLATRGLPDDLYIITLEVKDNSANIKINGEKKIKGWHIPFTDCPEGEWKFFYQNNVFMWKDEY